MIEEALKYVGGFASTAGHWLVSEKGTATLEYLGGLLIGQEVLATSLGEERTKRIARALQRLADALRPKHVRELAARLVFGVAAPVLCAVFTALAVAVAVFELYEMYRAGITLFSTRPATAPDGLAGVLYRIDTALVAERPPIMFDPAAGAISAVVLAILLIPIPALCWGIATEIRHPRASVGPPRRRPPTRRNTVKLGPALPFSDLIEWVVEVVSRASLTAGQAIGRILLAISTGTISAALGWLALAADKRRIRRIGVVTGLVMLTIAYVLKLTAV